MKARCLAAALALTCVVPAVIAADTISATHVFPASLIYSRSFLEFVKKANEAGKGVFSIQVRGGPEAIGMMEQPGAVRSGVVDMIYSPCAFYAAAVPECDAVSASTVDGPTARKNGGIDLLNQIHQKRAGVVLLGWVDSGIRFNLWSTKEPKLDSSGHIDIKGFKVRGNPIYNAFLTNYLGAQIINLNSPELFTALVPLKVRWSALWSSYLCTDAAFLDLAQRSGLLHVNIGLESIHPDTLAAMNKRFNKTSKYGEMLASLRRRGISKGIHCIYSLEISQNTLPPNPIDVDAHVGPGRARTPLGTISYMPAIFGLRVAQEAIGMLLGAEAKT